MRVSDFDADEQHLIRLANRMRLFAPRSVIEQAEAVIREIVDLARKPGMDVRNLTVEEVAERHSDPLLPFSVASRSDLDRVPDRSLSLRLSCILSFAIL
jgi:hypothetical protein